MMWQLKNYRTGYVSKVLNFEEVKENNFGRPMKQWKSFDDMNNHYFDYNRGSA